MSRALVVAAMLLASAGTTQAQHQGHGAPPPAAQDAAACLQGSAQGLELVESLVVRLEAAHQGNRAADLRAVLADVQSALTQLRSQLAACASTSQPVGGTPGSGGAAPIDHAAMGHGTPEPNGEPVKDPVQPDCREFIDPNTAPKAEYGGQVYYFCSEGNRQKFLAAPGKYIRHRDH